MTLLRTPMFRDLPTLREAVDRLFDESFFPPQEPWRVPRFERPAIDAYATPDAFVVKVAVPGLSPEHIHTTVSGDVLTVEGKYREETEREEKGYVYQELSRGELRRTIGLPAGLRTEAAEAAYTDGILTLTFPKLEATKPHEIKVTTT